LHSGLAFTLSVVIGMTPKKLQSGGWLAFELKQSRTEMKRRVYTEKTINCIKEQNQALEHILPSTSCFENTATRK
jgi:hypothetical protein